MSRCPGQLNRGESLTVPKQREHSKISMILPKVQDSYHIPSQDQRGHSDRIQFRAPSYFFDQIPKIMSHKEKFGWESDSEMFRWCLWYGMQHLERECKDPRLSSSLAIMNMSIRAGQFEHEFAQYQQQIDQVEKSVNMMISAGVQEKVQELLRLTQRSIESIQDESWRDLWQKNFDQKFGHLLK
jgi:hypothetical protein